MIGILLNYRMHSLNAYKYRPCIRSTKRLSALVLVLQQPLLPVSPCSHHTATLVTDPAITALTAINPFRYATIPTTRALASYATTSVAIILASYATISITTIATNAQPRLLPIIILVMFSQLRS